jgi:hypothetical protein
MKNLIGGLFGTQEDANQAHQALQQSGYASDEINVFVHKPRNKTARATNVRVQSIGKHALWGGVIGGALGALLGFLVGSGILPLPGLEPGNVNVNPFFVSFSVISGLVGGGLTGIILGVAVRLLGSPEKAEVMTRQIEKRGVLITVSVDGDQSETKARRILEEHGAEEVGYPSDKWDLDAWSSPNEISPSLRNLVNTR